VCKLIEADRLVLFFESFALSAGNVLVWKFSVRDMSEETCPGGMSVPQWTRPVPSADGAECSVGQTVVWRDSSVDEVVFVDVFVGQQGRELVDAVGCRCVGQQSFSPPTALTCTTSSYTV